MPEVTVFIPYYQRESGLLREAVRSVFAQSLFGAPTDPGRWEPCAGLDRAVHLEGEVELLIVDDGSPVPARDELRGLEPPPGVRVRIVEQENRGLIGARNRGLDEVDPATRYFAMVDSDDQWSPWHLERALFALRCGADVYTSNWFTAETGRDAFTEFKKLDLTDHEPLEGMTQGYRFSGDLVRQEVDASIGRPSALVFRWSAFSDLRNDPRLEHSSEDQLWRFSMFVRDPELVFSARPEVASGVGVSHFSGIDFVSERGLLALRDRIFCMRLARSLQGFSEAARPVAARAIGLARRDIAAIVLNRLARRRSIYPGALLSTMGRDPGMWLGLPWHILAIVGQKLSRRRAAAAVPRVTRWGS